MKRKILSIAVAGIVCSSVAEARFFIGVDAGYTAGISEYKGNASGAGNTRFLTYNASSWSSAFKTTTWIDKNATYTREPYSGFNVGLTLGSEHFFLDNYLGIRVGGLLGYTNYSSLTSIESKILDQWGTTEDTVTNTFGFLDAGVNLDLMVNFWSNEGYSFGVFGGVEADYHYLLQASDDIDGVASGSAKDFPSRHSLDLSGRVGISTLMADHHRLDILAKLPIGSVVSGSSTKVYLLPVMPTISINVGYKYVF